MNEFTTPPAQLAAWMICFGCVLWITLNAVKLAGVVRGRAAFPPNEQLQFSHDQLTGRVEKLEAGYESIRSEMRRDKDELLLAGEHRAEKIHNRFNTVLEAVSELRGRMENKK